MLVAGLAACAGAAAPPAAPVPAPPRVPADAERDFAIWLGGARVGIAHEVERWSPAGVVLVRDEVMQFLRGNVAIAITTTIEIAADPALAPARVTWTERAQSVRRGEAVRGAAGWTVTGDALVRSLPADAIPAELVPLIIRRDGRFAGPVFLPARGFAGGAGWIEPVAPRRLVARLAPGAGGAAAEATIDLGDDAMPVRVVDGQGVIATRITAAAARTPFVPVDLIAATAIPVAGSPGATPRLVLDGELAVPALPGQTSRPVTGGVELTLSPRLGGGGVPVGPTGRDRTRAIVALVVRVRRRIVPDLATGPASRTAAAAATAGDCTTFALAYAALAADRGIATRIVTGFRIDGDRLVRHRWAISWTGRAWIAVDAAFGAVPAGGDLVGLAVHDADDAGLCAGDAALTRVRAATWR